MYIRLYSFVLHIGYIFTKHIYSVYLTVKTLFITVTNYFWVLCNYFKVYITHLIYPIYDL